MKKRKNSNAKGRQSEKNRLLTDSEEQLIVEQIKYLHNELVSIQQAFLGYVTIPLGIYFLAIYYAFDNSNYTDIIFSILPFFFSLSFFNIIKYTIKMLGIDAYIAHMERLLNRHHRKNLFLWQNFLIYANGYSVIGSLCQIPAFAAISIFVYVKFSQSVSSINQLFPEAARIFEILLITEILFLGISLLACCFQYYTVLKWCRTIPLVLDSESEKMLSRLHTAIPVMFNKRKIFEMECAAKRRSEL